MRMLERHNEVAYSGQHGVTRLNAAGECEDLRPPNEYRLYRDQGNLNRLDEDV
jgi:hypothetical protein